MRGIVILYLLCPLVAAATPPGFSLSQAFEEALNKSDDLAVIRANVDRARAQKRQVLAAMLPTIKATGTYTLNDKEVRVGDRIVVRKHDLTARGRLEFSLLDARAFPVYSSASQRIQVAQDRLADAREELLLAVARSYYTAMAAERLVLVAEKSETARQEHLTAAKARMTAGHAIKLDVQRALVAVLAARKATIEAVQQRDYSRDELALIVGRTPPLEGTLRRPVQTADVVPTHAEAKARAVSRRRDLKALEAELEIAERNRLASWLSLLPSVGVVGNLDVTQEGFRNPDGGMVKTLMVNLSWVLYDGGQRYAQLDDDAAVIRQTKATLREKGRRLHGEVRNALRVLKTTTMATKVTDAELAAANAALDSAKAAFMLGIATGLDVLQAEETHVSAQVGNIREQFQLDLAKLNLRRVTGMLANWK